MWLGRLLMGARHFPGRIWSGKHRKVRKVTGHMKYNKLQRAMLVEQVERTIAVPYLTCEEEHAHNITKKRESDKKFLEQRRKDHGLGPDVLGLNSLHANKDSKSFLEHILTAKRWTPAE